MDVKLGADASREPVIKALIDEITLKGSFYPTKLLISVKKHTVIGKNCKEFLLIILSYEVFSAILPLFVHRESGIDNIQINCVQESQKIHPAL